MEAMEAGEYKHWNGLEWNGLLEWPEKLNPLGQFTTHNLIDAVSAWI